MDNLICEKHRIPIDLCKVCSNERFTEKKFTLYEVEALLEKQRRISADACLNEEYGMDIEAYILNAKLDIEVKE